MMNLAESYKPHVWADAPRAAPLCVQKRFDRARKADEMAIDQARLPVGVLGADARER
ncbi:hypothetical protein [Streptomyces sp. NPDC054961]